MARCPTSLALVLQCTVAASAGCQVVPGDRVRVWLRDIMMADGHYLRDDADSLYLLALTGADTLRLARADLTRAEVQRGTRRMGMTSIGRGALIGAAAGVTLGAMAGAGDDQGDIRIGAADGAAILGTLGTAAGVIVGSLFSVLPVEVWREFDLAHPERDPTDAGPGVREVAAGDTVRLALHDVEWEGVLLRATPQRIALVPLDRPDTVLVDVGDVTAARVRRGTIRGRSRLIGRAALAGAAVLGAMNQISGSTRSKVIAGTMIGATLGTLAGSAVALVPVEHWVRFDPRTRPIAVDAP